VSRGPLAGPDFGHPFLCRLADIPEGGGRGFWFGADTARFDVFVIRP